MIQDRGVDKILCVTKAKLYVSDPRCTLYAKSKYRLVLLIKLILCPIHLPIAAKSCYVRSVLEDIAILAMQTLIIRQIRNQKTMKNDVF